MSNKNCIVCKSIDKSIPSSIIYEDKHMVAFRDVAPQAPVHIVMVPKLHIKGLDDLTTENIDLVGRIIVKAKDLSEFLKIKKSGYRIVSNCGTDSRQSILHLHFHLLGGKPMSFDFS